MVKKCGSSTSKFCELPQLPIGTLSTLHALPDPIPGSDEHYTGMLIWHYGTTVGARTTYGGAKHKISGARAWLA